MGTKRKDYTKSERMLIDTLLFINLHKKNKIGMMIDRMHREMSLDDVAKKYNVSRNYVYLLEKRIITDIRTVLQKSFYQKLKEYLRIKQVK